MHLLGMRNPSTEIIIKPFVKMFVMYTKKCQKSGFEQIHCHGGKNGGEYDVITHSLCIICAMNHVY